MFEATLRFVKDLLACTLATFSTINTFNNFNSLC